MIVVVLFWLVLVWSGLFVNEITIVVGGYS